MYNAFNEQSMQMRGLDEDRFKCDENCYGLRAFRIGMDIFFR